MNANLWQKRICMFLLLIMWQWTSAHAAPLDFSEPWPLEAQPAQNLPIPQQGIFTIQSAKEFAVSFFTSTYVSVPVEMKNIEIVQKDAAWSCTFTHSTFSAELLFDCDGRILEYRNTDYQVPGLEGIHLDFLNEMIDLETMDWVHQLCDALFPSDIWCSGVIIHKVDIANQEIYVLVGEEWNSVLTTYFMIQTAPERKLLGFGDLRYEAARYGSYLSKEEAIQAAQTKIIEALNTTETNRILQANLVTSAGYFNATPIQETPFWYIVFENNTGLSFEVLIDAKNGEVLELNTDAGEG